ncbi:BEN domain-containing protein 4-like, partial [Vigna umbellata]|uniref:BEN domain-containing protein 4-like n=1 Tax=Vigna umbellata TaxID=87088 RepID=UPI001F5E576B
DKVQNVLIKEKGVARPEKSQRQAPKYVLRVLAKLPTTAAPSPSYVGPPPTPTIQPPTPAVDPIHTSAIHPYPTHTTHPSPTPDADHLPPPVIITLIPPPMLITPTPPPDPTSIPFSSCIPPSETVTPSADPDSTGDGEGLDLTLHDRPWIQLYEFRNKCAKAQRNRAFKNGGTLHTGWSITIHEHAIRMAQALGRAIYVDEVFAQTHVRKGTNEFVDERSQKTHEEFSMRLSQVRSEHGSVPTPDDASNGEDDIRRTQC